MTTFLSRQLQTFSAWWRAPATRKDRALGASIGGLGGFWIGPLGVLLIALAPVSIVTLMWAALAGGIAGVVLGMMFPKTVSIVGFPFALFGIGTH